MRLYRLRGLPDAAHAEDGAGICRISAQIPSGCRGHGGEYPDTMPQVIKLTDAEGRSCIYVPMMQDGKVVGSQGYVLDREDE